MPKRCRIPLAVVVIALSLSLTGCWSRVELSDRALVMATGVDREPGGQVRLILQVLNPSGIQTPGNQGGGNEPVKFFSATGATVSEAIREITTLTDRLLFWGHNHVIIVGEEAARDGLRPLLDHFDRAPGMRRRAWLLVARGKAEKIIKAKIGSIEQISAAGIAKYFRTDILSGVAPERNMQTFIQDLRGEGVEPILPGVGVVKEQAGGEEKVENLRIKGTAVFRSDRMVGWFDAIKSRGLLWARGEIKGGIVIIPPPSGKGNVEVTILRASRTLKPSLEGGVPSFEIKIYAVGEIGEIMSTTEITREEVFNSLQRRLASEITNEVEAALEEARRLKADVFGLGKTLYRTYPEVWRELRKDWPEEMVSVPVKVTTEVQIRRHGLIINPVRN